MELKFNKCCLVLGIICLFAMGCERNEPATKPEKSKPIPATSTQDIPSKNTSSEKQVKTTNTPAVPAVPVLNAPQAQTIQVAARPSVRNVAIFVKNRAGKQLDDKVGAFEDLVASRITDVGFSVISREDVANAAADRKSVV